MAKKYIPAHASNAKSKLGISSEEPKNYNDRPPIFSLEKLQAGPYCLSSLDQKGKADFAMAIFKRKDLKWSEIMQADRHGLGTEKIAKKAIKAPIPNFLTEDVDELLAFRFSGKKPMVGFRQRDTFFVLWLDGDFTLYPH